MLRRAIMMACTVIGIVLMSAYLIGRITDWNGLDIGTPYIFDHRRNVGCRFDGRHFLVRWSGLTPEEGAPPGTPARVWTVFGVRCEVEPNYVWCGRCITVRVSTWLPALLILAWPLVRVASDLRRRLLTRAFDARRRRGLCVACGYDLTGNISGVCPECGRPVVESIVS